MFDDIRKLRELSKSKHPHFISVPFGFYKKWKWIIKIVMRFNENYVSCEIFRRKFKLNRNFVVVGLKWNGKNVKRRVNGFAKEFISTKKSPKCLYCNVGLNDINATADHIIPISKGGNNTQVNIVVCCKHCNGERGNLSFLEYLKIKNPKYKNIKHFFL